MATTKRVTPTTSGNEKPEQRLAQLESENAVLHTQVTDLCAVLEELSNGCFTRDILAATLRSMHPFHDCASATRTPIDSVLVRIATAHRYLIVY